MRPHGRARRRESVYVGTAPEQLVWLETLAVQRPVPVEAIFLLIIDVDAGDQWDKVYLTTTVEVTPTTATVDGIPAAPFDGQHHAIAIACI